MIMITVEEKLGFELLWEIFRIPFILQSILFFEGAKNYVYMCHVTGAATKTKHESTDQLSYFFFKRLGHVDFVTGKKSRFLVQPSRWGWHQFLKS